MGNILVLFFVVIFLLAAVFRADYLLIFLYLLAGVYIASNWWGKNAARKILVTRYLAERAFFGERIEVVIEARNSGNLPVVWAHLRETLPVELAPEGITQKVVSIGPHEKHKISYSLDCRKRGFFEIGPMTLFSGDVFGLARQQTIQFPPNYLTVYPKIIPLTRIDLPTHSPFGTLRHHQPLSSDPARVRGKRDYLPGDTLRSVDWKASAVARRLQVKLFEPSISLETMIFLNLNQAEFAIKDLFRASELGIVVAASVASWVIRVRQAVGLCTNGVDSLPGVENSRALPPHQGQGHLMRLLEILARLQCENTYSLVNLLQNEMVNLTWGTTMIVITNQVDNDVFDALFRARQRGIRPILVLCGYVEDLIEIRKKAAYFEYPTYHFLTEKDLDIWRG